MLVVLVEIEGEGVQLVVGSVLIIIENGYGKCMLILEYI